MGSCRNPRSPEEEFVVAVVVGLVIGGGRQDQTDRPRREVVQLPPNHRPNVQAEIRPVEVKPFPPPAVVEHDVKAAGHGDQQLVQVLVSVPASLRPPWNVVEVVDAADVERDVVMPFNEREVAPRVGDLRELHHVAVLDRRGGLRPSYSHRLPSSRTPVTLPGGAATSPAAAGPAPSCRPAAPTTT